MAEIVCVCVCVCECLLLLAFFLVTHAGATTPTNPASEKISAAAKSRIQATFLKAPLHFEANQGQTDGEVKFLARGSGYSLFLTANEAVMVLRKPDKKDSTTSGQSIRDRLTRNPKLETRNFSESVVRMKLVGANPDAEVKGLEQLPGKVNYFIGNDPKKWRTNIPTYKRVEYKDIYPGINLVFYGNQRQLEYDFVVSPGADPKAIHLAFEGADKVEMQDSDLIITTASGSLRMHKPLVYQNVAGVKKEIIGEYVLNPKSEIENREPETANLKSKIKNPKLITVGLQLASYDTSRPLVIDPVLSYSTYLGGNRLDRGFAIAADASGNAYVTGVTSSTNFPTVNPYQENFAGANLLDAFGDAFVTKLNPSGSVVFSTYLGGSGDDEGGGIAVDASGNVYLAGDTNSSNFPLRNPIQPTFRGPNRGTGDPFVTKLNPAGNELIYSTFLGGTGGDGAFGIALDTPMDCAGRIRDANEINTYVAGHTGSGDFPVTAGAFQTTNGGDSGVFVAKINPAGSALVYSSYLGGSGYEAYGRVAVDCSGNAYVTGFTQSTDFPVTVGAFQTTYGGGDADAFVTKLNSAGSVVYSTYLGGSGGDDVTSIAVDASGSAYVTGGTGSIDFPTVNPFQAAISGPADVFVAKLNPSGNALVYSTYLGGSGSEVGNGVTVDATGNAYVTGSTTSIDFPTRNPIQDTNHGGSWFGNDAFVAKLNAAGNDLVYSTYLGGNGGYEFGQSVAVDSCGNAHVAGITDSTNFPTANAFQAAHGGGVAGSFNDAFVAKISTDANTFFHDDFNRPDSATVGNGWLDSPNNSGGNLSIRDGQLVPVGIGGSVQGIYRPFTFDTPISVTATVAESSGYGGLPRQYTAIFEILSNGTPSSGYWLDFVRSDINYSDSLIQLGDGANVIARFHPSIQFGPVLDLNFTFNVDGSVVGTVGQNGQTESFSFPAHAIQSTGNYFLVALSNPDGRAASNPIYHRLDDLTVSGACSPSAPPVANAGGPYTVAEGGTVTLTGSGSDPDGDPLTYAWDLDNNGSFETPGQNPTFTAVGRDGPNSQTVVLRVCDSFNACATSSATVNITNVAPSVGSISAPVTPNPVNSLVTASANFTDPGLPDTHTALWNWGDGSTSAGTVMETNGSGSVTGSRTYTAPGVYTVTLTVTDDDGGSGQSVFQYVVVYDPSAGFVTGGGWIDSPAGAYAANTSLAGKANFGFVSKYQKGANVPTGVTEFQFKVADINFHSNNYEWLVVGGPRAQYKGTGTINGTGNYKFILTAIDGQVTGGGGLDKFRIKIWRESDDVMIYDNQMGASDTADPTTQIGGGSIVIHTN